MRTKLLVGLGALVVILHLLVLLWVLEQKQPSVLQAPAARPSQQAPTSRAELYIDGRQAAPDQLARLSPGLRHLEWRETYLGGHRRSVGITELVGPFRPTGKPVCGVSLWIGPGLFADPVLNAMVEREITAHLGDVERWPLGGFRRADVSLELGRARDLDYALLYADLLAAGFFGDAPVLRARIELHFDRAAVPVVLALVPVLEGSGVVVRPFARARIETRGLIASAVVDLFDGNAAATDLARGQLASTFESLIARPPALELGGAEIEVVPCPGEALELSAGYLRVPLALQGPDTADLIASSHATPDPDALRGDLAVSVDLAAANALLHQLWKHGAIQRAVRDQLAALELDEWLSVQVEQPRLPLPPVIERDENGLNAAAVMAFSFRERGEGAAASTPARLFARAPIAVGRGDALPWRIELSHLDLTCVNGDRRYACFDGLEAAAENMAPPLQGTLGERLHRAVAKLLEDRPLPAGGYHLALESLAAGIELAPESAVFLVAGELRLVE